MRDTRLKCCCSQRAAACGEAHAQIPLASAGAVPAGVAPSAGHEGACSRRQTLQFGWFIYEAEAMKSRLSSKFCSLQLGRKERSLSGQLSAANMGSASCEMRPHSPFTPRLFWFLC